MKIHVYRVQNDKGIGMYRAHGSSKILWNNYQYPASRHPTPSVDLQNFTSFDIDRVKFAFSSIDQLYQWMNKKAVNVQVAEFCSIYIFEVDSKNVYYGSKQVAFRKNTEKFVKKIPLYGSIKEYFKRGLINV